jgi:hypothetical protein
MYEMIPNWKIQCRKPNVSCMYIPIPLPAMLVAYYWFTTREEKLTAPKEY